MASPNQVTKDFTLARTSLIMGAYAITQKLRQGQPLTLLREPTSKVYANDVMVVVATPGGNRKIGYLPLGLADEIAPLMDRNIKVIARKAPNVLYGICQLAYIKPSEEVNPETGLSGAEADLHPIPAEPPVLAPGVTAEVYERARANQLPEGVTQEDLDTATDLPPLGDSRRPHIKPQEDPNGEPTPDIDTGSV